VKGDKVEVLKDWMEEIRWRELDGLRVREQDLLQLVWTTRLPRCILLQLEDLDPALFTESLIEVE
jgi:hypothetical protein